MAVTIAKYFTPSGKDINHSGIKPDYEVKLSKTQIQNLMKNRDKIASKIDPQYARALQILQVKIAERGGRAELKK